MFVDHPATADDLAVRRLHKETSIVVDKIWETLNNEQRFAIIQEKGVEKEVLKMFRYITHDSCQVLPFIVCKVSGFLENTHPGDILANILH